MENFKIKIEDKNAAEYIAPKVFEFIEKILQNPIELGKGRAAKVFTREGESFCIKQIVDQNIRYSSNSIEGEMDIQGRAIKHGVRSPKLIMTLESDEGHKFIIMERVNGGSLKDIQDGVIEAPQEFDGASFWPKLEKEIRTLHEASIHHRDLHPGNVMFEYRYVRNDEGETIISGVEPVIIDYGLATVVHDEEENPYLAENFPRTGEVTRLPNDKDAVRRIKEEMAPYLT